MSENIKKNLLTELLSSSKAQKKELLKHLKPDTVKAIVNASSKSLTKILK